MLIAVSGVILTWASDIIPNFSSRSSPTDMLEKEVLIRIPRINVKYMYCMDMCKLNCVNYIFRCDHWMIDGCCFPSRWTAVIILTLGGLFHIHLDLFSLTIPLNLICCISLQNYKRTVQVVHRDAQRTWTRPNTRRLHTLYFQRLKMNFTMLAECIHMDRRRICGLPWLWSSIGWYNWWAFSCSLFDRYFYKILIDSRFARLYYSLLY